MGPKELTERAGRKPGKTGKLLRPRSLSPFKRKDAYGKAGAALDAYKNKLAKTYASLPGTARREQISELYRYLTKAETAIEGHQDQNKSLPRQEQVALEALENQLARERELLGELNDGKYLPRGTAATFERLLELKHVGMPLSAVVDIGVYNESNEEGSKVLGSGSFNTAHEISYANDHATKVFKPITARDHAMGDAAVDIHIPEDSPRYANRNVATSLVDQALGLNLIPKTNFARHEGQLGFVMDKVEEGSSPNDFDTRHPVLINEEDRSRILQEQRYLDMNQYQPGEFRQVMATKGYVINEAGDWERQASIADRFDTTNPFLINELSNLEWLDKITGQVDRHVGNYIVDQQPNSIPNGPGMIIRIKAIDNDFSFGPKHTDPSERPGSFEIKGRGRRLGSNFDIDGLPRLIGSSTADAITKMAENWGEEGGMKEKLSELLSNEEVAATDERLSSLCKHIEKLRDSGHVVSNWSDWTDADGRSAHDVLMAGERGSYIRMLADEGAKARAAKAARPTVRGGAG